MLVSKSLLNQKFYKLIMRVVSLPFGLILNHFISHVGAQSQGLRWCHGRCLVLWGNPLCVDGRISSI